MKFPNAGIVTLGCNIHDKMVAWVLVVDTPYFRRTDANGKVTLNGPRAGQVHRARVAPEDARRTGG